MESRVSLGGKEGRRNASISTESGIESGTLLWLEGRDLTNCANHILIKSFQWILLSTAKDWKLRKVKELFTLQISKPSLNKQLIFFELRLFPRGILLSGYVFICNLFNDG